MRVFSPMWFRIKTKSSCKDGSTQAWHQIHLSRYLTTKMRLNSSAAVCGAGSRDGFIRSRLESRSIMPTFNTKSEYKTG